LRTLFRPVEAAMDVLLGIVATLLWAISWLVPMGVFTVLCRFDERVPLRWLSSVKLGRLIGGRDRVVDVVVTDLVERGVLRAEYGAIAVASNHASTRPRDPVEAAVVDAVREVGRAGITAVRAEVDPGIVAGALFRARLRRWAVRTAWTLPVLALAAFAPPAGGVLLFRAIGEDFGFGVVFIVAGISWFPPALFTLALNAECPVDEVQSTLQPDSSQTRRVAVNGLEGLTDRRLRTALVRTQRCSSS
jgi:uncharacterized protein (TIGR04222 family)